MLTDRMVDLYFRGRKIEAGLAGSNGVELSDPGYTRLAPAWKVTDSEVSATLRFGPFPAGARFRSLVLFEDGQHVEAYPYDPDVQVAKGGYFSDEFRIRFT